MSLQVEIWSPALPCEPLARALEEAHLSVTVLASIEQRSSHHPLLLVYSEPAALLDTPAARYSAQPFAELLDALEQLELHHGPWRLVNLACLCAPALVAWCVEPQGMRLQPEPAPGFVPPDPLDALVALQWLETEPRVLQAYLRLEHHPRSAALDQRPADTDCPERLRQATSPAELAQARERQRALLAHLERADEQLAQLHALQLENQALRDRLVTLELNQEDRSDLELSLQLCQEDLATLSRRIALLEDLLVSSAEASRGAQICLAKALMG